MSRPLTLEEWVRRMGLAPLPAPKVDLHELDERDYRALANALAMWMETQHLTEGQGVIVMTELLGRVLGNRMALDMPAGVIGAQATLDALTGAIQVNLNRILRERGQ